MILNMNQNILRLYSTDGCHLCEQAIGMLYYAKQHGDIDLNLPIEFVDIIIDPKLVAQFGDVIPVLQRLSDEKTLNWPFEYETMVNWIKAK